MPQWVRPKAKRPQPKAAGDGAKPASKSKPKPSAKRTTKSAAHAQPKRKRSIIASLIERFT